MKKLALLSLLALGACSTQQYAGITTVEITMKPMCDGPSLAQCAQKISYIDGKEKANVDFKGDFGKGTFAYQATDVKAFDGQALRAAVDTVLIQTAGQTAPQIADAIVRAVMGAMLVP